MKRSATRKNEPKTANKKKPKPIRVAKPDPVPAPELKPKRTPPRVMPASPTRMSNRYVRKESLTPRTVHQVAAERGFRITQFLTDEVWVDIYGNRYNIDRTPIRWILVNK